MKLFKLYIVKGGLKGAIRMSEGLQESFVNGNSARCAEINQIKGGSYEKEE